MGGAYEGTSLRTTGLDANSRFPVALELLKAKVLLLGEALADRFPW